MSGKLRYDAANAPSISRAKSCRALDRRWAGGGPPRPALGFGKTIRFSSRKPLTVTSVSCAGNSSLRTSLSGSSQSISNSIGTRLERFARQIGAVHLRIDSIEQSIRESGVVVRSLDDAGYRVAYALAEDNLNLGRTVIADSVNPWPITRDAWRAVAERARVGALEIEVTCSNVQEHRSRVETRTTDVPGLNLPTWQDVVDRDYRPWNRGRLVLDTTGHSVEENVQAIRTVIGREQELSEPPFVAEPRPMRVIVITGSMGSGKTTVLGEASDLLTARGVVHAAIDGDALANGHLPVSSPDGVLMDGISGPFIRTTPLPV